MYKREKININTLKVDDSVFDKKYGVGKVINIDFDNRFCIEVEFEYNINKYTNKGLDSVKDKNPKLFIADIRDIIKLQKNQTWQDIYELPLKYDMITYAFSANDTMTLMFDEKINLGKSLNIVRKINEPNFEYNLENLTHKGCDFYQNDKYIFCVRGWGYLTGYLGLSEEKALEIQNGFIEYIYNQIKDKN